MTAGEDGSVWVVESLAARLHRFLPVAKGTGTSLVFDSTVLEGERTIHGPAGVLPLTGGGFVLADTLSHELRLYDARGKLLKKRALSYPNSPLALKDGGFAIVVTGKSRLQAFDDDLRDLTLPPALQEIELRDSVYTVDMDDGNVYWNSCPDFTRCALLRKRGGGGPLEVVGADHWLAGYDETDPAYSFCVTSDGRRLSASQTLGAVVEYSGALAKDARPPAGVTWDQVWNGFDTGTGLRMTVFGDEEHRSWVEQGRRERRVLLHRRSLAHRGLGTFLALLMLVFLVGRMVGRQGGLATTLWHVSAVFRNVLWPDRTAFVRWALPGVLVWAVAAAVGLALVKLAWAGTVELLALAVVTGFVMPHALSARRLAEGRSAATAWEAFALYLSPTSAQPLPRSVTIEPQLASFAAPPASARLSGGAETILENLVEAAGSGLDAASVLEGGLYLLAWGERRLVYYPCQLGGKPRGTIRVAAALPRPEEDSEARYLDLGDRRFVGVHAALVGRLGPRPKLGELEELCQICGREVVAEPRERCSHQRPPSRLALALAVLFPGLGHLAARRYQRGRWLAVAGGLLLSRILYLAVPMLLGSLPFQPFLFVVPGALYAVVWWISLSEIREMASKKGR